MPVRKPGVRPERLRVPVVATCAALFIGWVSLLGSRAALANPAVDGENPVPVASSAFRSPTDSQPANLVNILFTVRDKKDKPLPDLTKSDFALVEDGHPQTIQLFNKAVTQPLTLGLLVDTGASQRPSLGEERTASRSFFDQIVREDLDKAFLIHFDHQVELLQDLTPSHEKLEKALNTMDAPQFAHSSGPSQDPDEDGPRQGPSQGSPGQGGPRAGRRPHAGGGTQLYDAIFLASNELMKKQSGRKAMVVLSNGVDRGSKESLESALESAQRANTVVYSILIKGAEANSVAGGHRPGGYGIPGMGGPGMGGPMGRRGGRYPQPQENRPDGKKILEQISSATGGRLFEVSKKLPLDQIYSQIEQELRNQYTLGFSPARPDQATTGYHKLQVTTKKKDVIVQARDGYYSDSTR